MLRPEPLDIVIIIFVALLLFGANRLPETARGMGQAIREFRAAITGRDGNDVSPEGASLPRPAVPVARDDDTNTVSCKNCGKPIQQGSKFCHECGTAQ